MKKVNLSNEGVLTTKNFNEYEALEKNFFKGGRNIFIPFKNMDRGIKIFLRNGDDPHRIIDQAFPNPPYHYDNPDDEVIPLRYDEFKILKSIYKFFERHEIGSKVYDEIQIRVNSKNHYALIVEDLGNYPNPSQKETFEQRDKINKFLISNNYFKNIWEDEEPDNYFKTPERGILAVDIDWGLVVHYKINPSYFGSPTLSLSNDNISSEIALATVCIDLEEVHEGVVDDNIIPNFKNYAWKHDYDFYVMRDALDLNFKNNAFAETRCKTLYKITLIEELLKKGYKYVAIIDGFDALITNDELPLETFIDDYHSIFFSADVTGWDLEETKRNAGINTGFAIYKNTNFTKKFLEKSKSIDIKWNDHTRNVINDQVLFQKVLKNNLKLWDDIALGDPLQQSFWFYNKPSFQHNHNLLYNQHKSPYIWKDGDFMIHFAGQFGVDKLIKLFNRHLKFSASDE